MRKKEEEGEKNPSVESEEEEKHSPIELEEEEMDEVTVMRRRS